MTESNAALEILQPSALESIERANVDMAIATARRYPRNITAFVRNVKSLATLDEETAQSCYYKLKRGGKSIEGPSIRLAEIAVSSYGNIRFGARIMGHDGKHITAQGFCHDLETNVMNTMEVRRRITNSGGETYSDDMIVVTGNAACAIAARNAVFKVIPFATLKKVYQDIKQTAVGNLDTLTDRRTRMVTTFAALGVNQKQVCAAVGKEGLEDIGLAELEELIGIHNAIRDGDQQLEEAFPPEVKKARFGPTGPAVTPTNTEGQPLVAAGSTGPVALGQVLAAAGPTGPVAEAKAEAPPPAKEKVSKKEKAMPPRATPLEGVRNLLKNAELEEGPLLAHLFGKQMIQQGQKLEDLAPEQLQDIIDSWVAVVAEIKS